MRTIDLAGPEGNVFSLMACAQRWARQLGRDGEKILLDMQSNDYSHAVDVFEKEFGHLCKLVNKPGEG